VTALVDWVADQPDTAGLGIGLFGASTGAAAALVAAAARPDEAQAVVSRGGRPDLAGGYLAQVRQPTLLIVGQLDPVVIDVNGRALDRLPGERQLVVVPGASHLFAEPGTLEQVARLARDWFLAHLRSVYEHGRQRSHG
jgi:pimeloyl-ACP methyl ester carboxylesterase